MITKTKKSISMSNSQKQQRRQRDKKIIMANATRFNKQAEENLKFQATL
jgi:hypothetical protein